LFSDPITARIFSRLRIIPNSATPSAVSTVVASSSNKPSTGPAPVDIYFHVWKPASNYKKSSPPPPDFYVSVVEFVSLARCLRPSLLSRQLTLTLCRSDDSARESPLPSLGELMAMLDQTPDLPEPPARGAPAVAVPVTASSSLPSSAAADRSWRSFLPFSSFAESSSTGSTSSPVNEENVPPRGAGRNPMPYLKQGDRNVVVAVVKDGGVSWMRFGRGVFGQMAIQ
jgi:tRNA-splicing endonuclease subunit Sen54